ncbi:MAG: hypothetical protein ACJ8GN_23030 [Longimicrobiaceae bacterium]
MEPPTQLPSDPAAPRARRTAIHIGKGGKIVRGNGDVSQRIRLTMRVGVTGHRTDALVATEAIGARIRSVLRQLKKETHVLARQDRDLYAPGPVVRLISPLASGADQIVAREAVSQGYELHCPLPFGRRAYLRDFESKAERRAFGELLRQARRVLELDGSRAGEDQKGIAYLEAGRVVLRNSDLLIAVWDGEPLRGVGGTAQIVSEAMLLEIPIVRIDPAFPHRVRVGISGASGYRWTESLAELRPGLRKSFHLSDPMQHARLLRFEREPVRPGPWGWFPDTWTNVVTVGAEHARRGQRRRAHPGAPDPGLAGAPTDLLSRVDAAALRYAGLYRSAFLVNFLFAAFAVLLAVTGFVLHILHVEGHVLHLEEWTRYVAFGELTAVGVVLLITMGGARAEWHLRWLDYRLLAEQLRQVAPTSALGRVPAAFRTSVDDADHDPRHDWTAWLVRAIVRHTGFPSAQIDAKYLQGTCRVVVHELIDPQLRYHGARKHLHHLVHHRLHRIGELLFISTAIAIAVHLIGHDQLLEATSLVLMSVAVFFPAFGAALAGILGQGEYQRTSSQSAAMMVRLEQLKRQATKPDAPLTSQSLGRIVEQLTELLSDELLGWRVVFRGKPLTLPA